MAEQEQNATDEPVAMTSEDAVEGSRSSAAAGPPLNRAERRAQAKGKKGHGAAFNPATPQSGNAHGVGNRGAGQAGQVRFPRTGHK